MHKETQDRMQHIRAKLAAGEAQLSDLKAQLAANKDEYIRHLLKQAENNLHDVEALFLGILKQERIPPRSVAEEANLLNHAQFFMEKIALPQVTAIKEMVEKFGPGVQSFG